MEKEEKKISLGDTIMDLKCMKARVVEIGNAGPIDGVKERWFEYVYFDIPHIRFRAPIENWDHQFSIIKNESPVPGIDPANRHSPLDEVIPAQRELNQMLYDESDRKANCIREYFASLGVPDGIVPGDELDGLFRDKKIYFLGVIPNTKNQFVFYNEDGGFECCGKISRPEKQPAEKTAREKAKEILIKHVGLKGEGYLLSNSANKIIDAIEEALTKNQK